MMTSTDTLDELSMIQRLNVPGKDSSSEAFALFENSGLPNLVSNGYIVFVLFVW